MRYPPIFQVAAADPGVTALLGVRPMRLYLFGLAPPKPKAPYCVWQVISGAPEIFLAGRPDAEAYSLQVDIYAASAEEARATGHAIEYAVELSATVTGYSGESLEAETGLYRYSFDVDWIVQR